MFKDLAKDIVTVEKADGSQIGGVRALVQSKQILIPDSSVALEEGDIIRRSLRSGTEELFEVIDRNFIDIGHGVDAHYQAKVKRVQRQNEYKPLGEVDPRCVFLVHGRDQRARIAVASFLRAIDLRPLEWNEAVKLTGKASPFIGEVIEAGFGAAQAVVVLLTGDDLACLREELRGPDEPQHECELTPQARPNVLFEAGFAFARHPNRTVLVEFGKLRPFSDVQGRFVIRFQDSTQCRQEFAERLQSAGCRISLSGTEWHHAGDFKLE